MYVSINCYLAGGTGNLMCLFKILGHIAASNYLSDGSRKGCNVLTKTT